MSLIALRRRSSLVEEGIPWQLGEWPLLQLSYVGLTVKWLLFTSGANYYYQFWPYLRTGCWLQILQTISFFLFCWVSSLIIVLLCVRKMEIPLPGKTLSLSWVVLTFLCGSLSSEPHVGQLCLPGNPSAESYGAMGSRSGSPEWQVLRRLEGKITRGTVSSMQDGKGFFFVWGSRSLDPFITGMKGTDNWSKAGVPDWPTSESQPHFWWVAKLIRQISWNTSEVK